MQYIPLAPDVIPALAERESLLATLLATVHDLAARSGVPDAAQVASLLSDRHVLRIPWGVGHQVAYYRLSGPAPVQPEHSIFIALVKSIDTWRLLPDDVARQFTLPSRLAQTQGAYYKSTRTIYLAADGGLSPSWLSLLLLHEGVHALDHLHGKNRDDWQTEWHARNVEYRVLRAQYGNALAEMLDERDLQAEILARLETGERLKLYESHLSDEALDGVFGPAASRADATYRRTLVGRCFVQRTLEAAPTANLRRLAVT